MRVCVGGECGGGGRACVCVCGGGEVRVCVGGGVCECVCVCLHACVHMCVCVKCIIMLIHSSVVQFDCNVH